MKFSYHAKLACLVAILAFPISLNADSFKFSYTSFDLLNPGTVTGTFEGTSNGTYVYDISNLSFSLNGFASSGVFTNFEVVWDGNAFSWYQGQAKVHFDVSLNNFYFLGPNSDQFYIINEGLFEAYGQLEGSGSLPMLESPPVGSHWSLSRVPDTGSSLSMMSAAFLSLSLIRRKFSSRHSQVRE